MNYLLTSSFLLGKYKRGRLVKEQWVFGGVERGTNKCFLVKVPNRTRSTLIEIVKKYILPQTTIISDCWRAYDTLP
jgi:transposase-like protein